MNEIEKPLQGHSSSLENQLLPYNELQKFLDNHKIPVIKSHPKTFMGIARQPHYENVLSNMLAFYFDVKGVHGLKSLFIDTFLEMIEEVLKKKESANVRKERNLAFHDGFAITTEYKTQGDGYIDILLKSDSSFIVIENKVYHKLINDLNDYWISAADSHEDAPMDGIGVILSLYGVSDIAHKEFINITHHEFFKRVMNNIGPFLLDGHEKYIVFLKDLYQNIINLSQTHMKEKDMEFYFQNQDRINQIAKLNQSVINHIINEVNKAGQILDGVDLVIPKSTNPNKKRLRYYRSRVNKEVNVAVVFENIRKDGSFYMVIEVVGELLKRFRASNPLDSEFGISNGSNEAVNKTIRKDLVKVESNNNTWAHVYRKVYYVNPVEAQEFSIFIQKMFNEDHFRIVLDVVEKYAVSPNSVVLENGVEPDFSN